MTINIKATTLIADHGTLVEFGGVTQPDDIHQSIGESPVTFYVDHRMAQPIADEIAQGHEPVCSVEYWAIGRFAT